MDEPRTSPLLSQVLLWVAFAMLVVASVLTVLVPELVDDTDEDEAASPATVDDGSS
jgi:hypothetical protein